MAGDERSQRGYKGYITWKNDDGSQSWIISVWRLGRNSEVRVVAFHVLTELSNSFRAEHLPCHVIKWPDDSVQIMFGERQADIEREAVELLGLLRRHYPSHGGRPIRWARQG